MTRPRKTKAQNIAEQKAALRQRIADIYCGAGGRNIDTDDDFPLLDEASRFIPAMKALLVKEGDKSTYLWESGNLDHFDSIDSATDFLFAGGIRA